MKKLPILLAAFTLLSCSTDDTYTEDINTANVTKMPVPDHMVGEYKSIEGFDYSSGKDYEQGTVKITKEVIEIELSETKYYLLVKTDMSLTTTNNVKIDCYYSIKIIHSNGTITEIRISDMVIKNGEIRVKVNGVTIAILKVVRPEQPQPPVTPIEIN